MNSLRNRLDSVLERMALTVYDHPVRALAAIGIILIMTSLFIPFVNVEVSTQGNFQKSDEVLRKYIEFKKQFGADESIIIVLNPKDIFDMNFLHTLRDFQAELEESIPYLDEVTSILNVTAIRGKENEVRIEDLFTDWPESKSELESIRSYVMNHPDYIDNIVSANGQYTIVSVTADAFLEETSGEASFYTDRLDEEIQHRSPTQRFIQFMKHRSLTQAEGSDKIELTAQQTAEIVVKTQEIADKYNSADFPLFVTGGPVINKLHVDVIGATVKKTIGMSILVMTVILIFIFRRASGVIAPLLVVILSLVTTFGIMSILGIPMRTTSQIFPAMILAAGICDSVHLFSIFFQKYRNNVSKRAAIGATLRHSGLAMFFTTLTTAGGFLSFSFSELRGISEVGLCASIGIVLALVYSYILIPAIIAIFPIQPTRVKQNQKPIKKWESILVHIADYSVSRPMAVLLPVIVIVIVAAVGASKIEFSFNMITWFPPEERVELNNQIVETQFKASSSLEIIVDTGRENGLFDPAVMKAIEKTQRFAENVTTGNVPVGKTSSIVNILKLMNQELNGGGREQYRIPDDKATIAQELSLYENSGWENLENLVDRNFSKTRITVGVPTVNSIYYIAFRDKLEREINTIFEGVADVAVTGSVDLGARSIWGLMNSLSQSYLIAFGTIALFLILLMGSLKIGLISMIPNFLPILIVLGIMGYSGLPITVFTVLLGGIAIGLAVDDTIHFLNNFKREFDSTQQIAESVKNTVLTTGRALFFTSLVMSIGFLAYLFSDMSILVSFGILVALTIVLAFISDIVVTPALVSLVFRKKNRFVSFTYPVSSDKS